MRLFAWELRKLAGDGPARAGVAIVAVVLVLGLVAFRFAPSPAPEVSLRKSIVRGEIPLPAAFRTGFGYARLVLRPVAGVLIPAVLCIVLGGTLARESERGTLAEVLVRPAARWKTVAAKTAAGLVYSAVLVCVAALLAVAFSSLVLGAGELVTGQTLVEDTVDGFQVRRPEMERAVGVDAVGRLAAAYALAGVGLGALVSLVVLASATAERSRTATLVAAGTYFGLYAVTHTPGVGAAKRYLVLDHFEMWEAVLRTQVLWSQVWRGTTVLAVVFALLTTAAMMVLKGREFPGRPDA